MLFATGCKMCEWTSNKGPMWAIFSAIRGKRCAHYASQQTCFKKWELSPCTCISFLLKSSEVDQLYDLMCTKSLNSSPHWTGAGQIEWLSWMIQLVTTQVDSTWITALVIVPAWLLLCCRTLGARCVQWQTLLIQQYCIAHWSGDKFHHYSFMKRHLDHNSERNIAIALTGRSEFRSS